MKIEEGLIYLHNKTSTLFLERGFIPNKKMDAYKNKRDGIVNEFNIHLSRKNDGRLFHHFTISYTNEKIKSITDKIDIEVFRKDLSRNWFPIEKMQKLVKLSTTAGITDWKNIYSFNKIEPKYLWFTFFDEMVEQENFINDYAEMIDLGVSWFDRIQLEENLLRYLFESASTGSLEKYLTIIKMTNPSELDAEYLKITSTYSERHGWDKNEVKAFYEELHCLNDPGEYDAFNRRLIKPQQDAACLAPIAL